MRIAEVDGVGRLEFPDDTPDSVIQSTVRRVIQEKSAPTPTGERFLQGMRDPVDAGAQLLTRMLPESVVSGVNRATQFVNEIPGIGSVTRALGITPATSQQIDAGIAEREAAYAGV